MILNTEKTEKDKKDDDTEVPTVTPEEEDPRDQTDIGEDLSEGKRDGERR